MNIGKKKLASGLLAFTLSIPAVAPTAPAWGGGFSSP